MNNKEEWRPIEGYEGICEVSSKGRVRSIDRYIVDKNGMRKFIRGRYLSIHKDRDGYNMVSLNKNNTSKMYSVHRLVAYAFIANPNNLPSVNHINEIKTDNRVENLEWCSVEYNNTYGTRLERMVETKEKQKFAK